MYEERLCLPNFLLSMEQALLSLHDFGRDRSSSHVINDSVDLDTPIPAFDARRQRIWERYEQRRNQLGRCISARVTAYSCQQPSVGGIRSRD
jgi:hypothetical protein